MQRQIITTADGSKTIQIEAWNEQYHSLHGAIQEANHVYINHGLLFCLEAMRASEDRVVLQHPDAAASRISVLEIGFGTGLNAFLTLLQAARHQVAISYFAVEGYPVLSHEIADLNYPEMLQVPHLKPLFNEMHNEAWEQDLQLTPDFSLFKQQKLFQDITAKEQFDLIYFDAFGARVQPELWTESIFQLMFEALKDHGTLVTYAAKGSVRRAMQTVGFTVEKLAGPPGKREMLRARKLVSKPNI